MQLEVAYDTLLMQAMQKRIKGEVAGQSVRFADVPKRRAAGQVNVSPYVTACLVKPELRKDTNGFTGSGCKASNTKTPWWFDHQ